MLEATNSEGYVDFDFINMLDSIIIDDIEEYRDELLIKAYRRALKKTEKITYQAMEGLVHNLNTMNSRAGAQVPFSSVNFGLDTTPEGRMVSEQYLRAHMEGLGHGETPIFPIAIFTVKEGINYNPEDPNYDLFKLAIKCSSKRMFPNFSFIDNSFNLPAYEEDPINGAVSYMGCRTRVVADVTTGKSLVPGRGNLSFTSINLPRLGIKNKGNIDRFFQEFDKIINLVKDQLLERFEIQCNRKKYNFPFLLTEGVWINSEEFDDKDGLYDLLKHGTLSIGFIGLAECLKALIGKHHGESEEAQELGLKIIGYLRDKCDEFSKQHGLNFTCLATPAEGLSSRFTKIDRKEYGLIDGVTDRDYYTNSSHIPVYYNTNISNKINLEAPYHALENAGHICYVEFDGDPSKNSAAFEKVIRMMKDAGVGYGAINHPLDRDPECHYNGIIDDICPGCGRTDEDGLEFERIRRITGYLVGSLDRFNNGKRAEEKDRVKHSIEDTKGNK